LYSPVATGHYALAAAKYCHFTSPIRRYADLMVHRALQAHLVGDTVRARCQYTFPELSDIGQHLSETEQAAEAAEQELKAILTLGLLQKLLGREVEGVVVSLSAFGASVHLPEYRVEGMVAVEALGPDQWQFDEQNQFLFGRHTGVTVRLGQALRVRIANVHPAARQLDLAPALKLTAGGAGKPPRRKNSRRRSRRGPPGRSGRRR
jgi:ribonuclease R